jgi:tRNA(Ile)-lysidine synthase
VRYHVCVHLLAQRVVSEVRREKLLRPGERVGAAVSGGIDSVALLRLLLELRGELGIVLSVVHFNHKLRGEESETDEQFVANLAGEHGLEFHADSDDVAGHATEEQISVEAAARELRYGFFHYLLGEDGLQGLKPDSIDTPQRGAEAPLFHGTPNERESPLLPQSTRQEWGAREFKTKLDKIVTGHTLDDQAETVLMRMIRGAGTRGLGGIHPRIEVEGDDGEICGEIVRPLLAIRRCELEKYLRDIGQDWREDSSNSEDAFTRNRVRRLLVPLIEKEFNPAVTGSLAELAAIARDEEDYWDNEVAGWMGTAVHWSEPEWVRAVSQRAGLVQISALAQMGENQNPHFSQNRGEMGHPQPKSDDLAMRIGNAAWLVMNASVSRMWFLAEPVAVQRRLIKAIGEEAGIPLEFKHVEEIRRRAEDDATGKEVSLPLGWKMSRGHDELIFVTPDLRQTEHDGDYEYDILIPGRATVGELNSLFDVVLISAADAAGNNSDQLLDAQSLARSLRVRNWRPGDRFWPAHTKSPKKVKELLQELHVTQTERKLWPVVVSNNEIVWMRGFPTPAKFQPQPGRDAVLIAEKPLREDS